MEAPAEAVRTPSGSSDGSLTNPDDKLRLLSVVGGDPLYFDWKQGESNTDMVNIIFDLINGKVQLIRRRSHGAKIGLIFHSSPLFAVLYLIGMCFNIYIYIYIYIYAVSSARRLNSHYQPWSSEVYGETRYEQMQLIIDQLKFKESDVFVDLGSGVGHLVLYVAGGTRVKKAVGIERAALPSEYAENMKTEFHRWMRWWKKKYRPFMLERGDFLDNKFRDLITKEATIIFINNYAFTPDLETCIKRELLSECRDGTRIVSTKSYATGTKEINDRLLNDVESILDVRQLDTVEHPTSWTDKHVPYFLHTVNRGRVGNKSHVKVENKQENGDGHEGSHEDNYDEENA
uniref:Histone-lysine N-methyltransferase, H3 lysine-79 specific n=1 Tax=Heterorhabditis bacteriophora TaxID=37862 RepID=A0A1I7XFA0_HETBA